MTEPTDLNRLHLLDTERSRPELTELDLLPTLGLVELMSSDARRVPEAVAGARVSIAEAVDGIVAALAGDGRLVYVGAGTAGRLGMLDAAEAGPTFNAPQGQVVAVLAGGVGAFDVAAENAEDDRSAGAAALTAIGISARDAVVGITASGRTPYVLGAIEEARRVGALTIGLVGNRRSPLADLAQIAIEVPVGAEVLAGSTRLNAGTAQKVVLNILSTAAMIRLGKTHGSLMIDVRATNAKLRSRATRMVSEIASVSPEVARAALERCDWRPKLAAGTLLSGLERSQVELALERQGGRLRAALADLSAAQPGRSVGRSRRLGVAGAIIDGVLVRGDIEIVDKRISAVGLTGHGTGLALPGLVDAQVNGYGGIDLLSAGHEEIVRLGEALRRDGVVAYQPTLITGSEEATVAALAALAEAARHRGRGAEIIGVHLEGPFIAPGRAGAHPVEEIRGPDVQLLERLLAAGNVTTVTLAPELPGALDLIRACVARGVRVSLGHSDAGAGDAGKAFEAGAITVTHLFNAMAPIAAREPGLAGAALTTPGVTVQVIADGVHVSDALIELAFAVAPNRVALVSDAIAAAGSGDGSYRLGTVEITVESGVARRSDGTLAGSAARLVDGLRLLARLGIDAERATATATATPARLLGRPDLGRLTPGCRADLMVVDDSFEIRSVLVGGMPFETERVGTG